MRIGGQNMLVRTPENLAELKKNLEKMELDILLHWFASLRPDDENNVKGNITAIVCNELRRRGAK